MYIPTQAIQSLNTIDYTVIGGYLIAMLVVGLWFSRNQRTEEDYLLGGRKMHWFLIATSSVATAFSGISLVGAPGYVFANDSRMFLAIIFSIITLPVALLVLPFVLWLRIFTVYEYLGRRFSPLLRLIASALFQIGKLAYAAVVIYTPSLLLSSVSGLTLIQAVLIVGTLSTLLAMLGGMRSVVWTDTIQFFIMMLGIGIILYVLVGEGPGFDTMWQSARDAGRTRLYDWSFSLTELTVWSVLVCQIAAGLGATFSDQVTMQRYMSTGSAWSVTKSYIWTTVFTIPAVGVLYVIGIMLYGFYADGQNPLPEGIRENGDKVLPYFITTRLPAGLSGLVLAAIIAATVSTVTSVLNSLCAATMSDFVLRRAAGGDGSRAVMLSRAVTIVWGVLGITLACFVGKLGMVLEQAQILTGLIGGGLGGVFFLGLFTRRANATGAIVGAIAGTLTTAYVTFFTDVHFMWYFPVGMFTCVVIGYGISLFFPEPVESTPSVLEYWRRYLRHRGTDGDEYQIAVVVTNKKVVRQI
jgi:SSS family transporter